MPVQELEDLAQWLKQNVLDFNASGTTSVGFNPGGIFESSAARSANSEAAKPSEEDDALSLLEYIIGVS